MSEKIILPIKDIFRVLDALKLLVFDAPFPFSVSWKIGCLIKNLENASEHLFERLDMVLGTEWRTTETLTNEQKVVYDAVMEQVVEFGEKIQYDWSGWATSNTTLTVSQADALYLVFQQVDRS